MYVNEKLNEFNEYIKFRKIAVIGLGVSNLPLLDYLHDKKSTVTIFDDRNIDELPKEIVEKITNYGFNFSFGKNSLEKLQNFDLIFRSPSCLPTKPELQAEIKRGAIVTTEIELLMKMCPSKIIGVTGSDGKTTTTSLIYAILKDAGYNTYLGGNIGTPLFTKLEEMQPEDIVVLELSSFQLMGMEVSPNIAVITNITPNHLNIHKDFEEYIDAKKNIFKFQNENDILIKLNNSKFRSSFKLKETDFDYIKKKGIKKVEEHAYDFITNRLGSSNPKNDGKQTPMHGHPVFIAQHATATCCRGCLFKWHHIAKNKTLSQQEIDYIVRVIMLWINNQIKKHDKLI